MRKRKTWYAILLAATLLAFLMPWYPTEVPRMSERKRAMDRIRFNKTEPSIYEPYFIGRAPYSGLDVLPCTTPSIVGLLTVGLVRITKRGHFWLALLAGLLLVGGVLGGIFAAPAIATTWQQGDYLFGGGGPALGTGWWLALRTRA